MVFDIDDKSVSIERTINSPLERLTPVMYAQKRLITVWIDIFVYGIYTVLFSLCIYLFRSRKKSHPVVVSSTISLYFLCTAKLLLDLMDVVLQYRVSSPYTSSIVYEAGVYVYITAKHSTGSLVADSLLIYRCYIIWNSRVAIIFIPVICLLATAVVGYLTPYTGINVLYVTLATNILVTGLTAGRIWWIKRHLSQFLGPHATSKYDSILAIIVESGLLYPMFLLIYLGMTKVNWGHWMTYYLISQVVGIAPTILLVRVGLGLDVNEESIRTLEFAKSAAPADSSSTVTPV
ncbi:hypothetical protein ONZ45_g12197 [Pleurotus djamor]|nr:hypothetical protein ONZ45_g12197 [Pleurotus djamor]